MPRNTLARACRALAAKPVRLLVADADSTVRAYCTYVCRLRVLQIRLSLSRLYPLEVRLSYTGKLCVYGLSGLPLAPTCSTSWRRSYSRPSIQLDLWVPAPVSVHIRTKALRGVLLLAVGTRRRLNLDRSSARMFPTQIDLRSHPHLPRSRSFSPWPAGRARARAYVVAPNVRISYSTCLANSS